jgi:hypothetical protein
MTYPLPPKNGQNLNQRRKHPPSAFGFAFSANSKKELANNENYGVILEN